MSAKTYARLHRVLTPVMIVLAAFAVGASVVESLAGTQFAEGLLNVVATVR